MTSLGFDDTRATAPGPVVPRRSVPLVDGEAQVSMTRGDSPARARHLAATDKGWMRVGVIPLDSAARYLVAWAVGICAVMVVVLVLGYALLSVLGVVGSVSRGLAVLSGDESSSVLGAQTVLPAILLGSVLLSGLWLVAAFGAVLVHNAVTQLTGGLRVRIRPDAGPPLRLGRR